ncbi:ABC transporter ATP-binding protein [Paenibacillus sp. FSL H8-0548]|uniref:ABC transporter ATP-binding protein n=1 Tax=Paenibacillus sp. FSL H8-0548 TaxID=1920422 RepID=UPI00096D0B5C|nr:ABC transporter ATP-binding protein [Paenibacillus sp. FSL H8-0548]OMF25841.1 ABC transporter ATP-binding protein [Paenibacillus sp. FSL H8-0548]
MINVNHLKYAYPASTNTVLNDLSFSIAEGEVFGFLGPSGAGKSTTQKILIGALKNYTGSVQVLGNEIKNTTPDYYERIGVAFEFPNFYSKFTALENLNVFRSLYAGATEEPMRLLELVGLEEAAHMKVSQLSKGMKMRLNFCRSLLHRPSVLFLDEPTSGLDPVNAKRMKDIIIEKKASGTTIVITTHNMVAAEELCDRVAFIVDGHIKLIDSPRELKLRFGQKQIRVDYLKEQERLSAHFSMIGLADDPSFLNLLRNEQIETIHSLEASLEQIFIDITGRLLQ